MWEKGFQFKKSLLYLFMRVSEAERENRAQAVNCDNAKEGK